jgi:hypothetical protein
MGTGLGLGIGIPFRRMGGGGGFDPDAAAFFARVTAAGGTLSATEQTAVNQLVLDMKSAGIWNSMKAIYPMVGASAAACAQNLKSSSFTGTFTSGWTFASTGVTGNGTSTHFDTGLNGLTSLSLNNTHLSFYSRTNNVQAGVDIGTENTTIQYYLGALYYRLNSSIYSNKGTQPSDGMSIASRLTSTQQKFYKNASLFSTDSNNSTFILNRNLYLGAWNEVIKYPTDREYAFASIGDGLTDTQASDFYTSVQAFQTTLSRQV